MTDFATLLEDPWFVVNQLDLKQSHLLPGDASTRRYARLQTNEKKNIIFVQYDLSENSKESFDRFIFWQKIYQENGILVPEILHVNKSKYYMALSDLGDTSLLAELTAGNPINQKESLKKCIDIIKLIQGFEITSQSKSTSYQFDQRKLEFELDITLKNFSTAFPLSILLDQQVEIKKAWEVIWRHAFNPDKYVWCHRDFHSKNIMALNSGHGIIDFQDTMKGPVAYDLCSLIHDCYISYAETEIKDLLQYAYKQLPTLQIRPQIVFEEFLLQYYAVVAQRTFKAIGSFCYVYQNRKNHNYLRHVGLAMEHFRLALSHIEHKFPQQVKIFHQLIIRPYYDI